MKQLVTHEGRKQWPRKPLLYIAYKPHNNMYRYCNPNILEAMQIVKDFEMAEGQMRQFYEWYAYKEANYTRWFVHFCLREMGTIIWPNRTKNPKGNIEGCEDCDGMGVIEEGTNLLINRYDCVNCNGTGQTTPQNYQGGRE